MKIALVSPYEIATYGGVSGHVRNLAQQFVSRGHDVRVLAPCDDDRTEIDGVPLFSLGRTFEFHTSGSVAKLSLMIWHHWKVKKYLNDEQFDILHAHEPFAPFAGFNVLHTAPCPRVGTFHAYNEGQMRMFLLKPILQKMFNTLDGWIAVSDASKSYVSRRFPAPYEIIPNGADFPHFSKLRPRRPEFDDGKINILFVGRGEVRKGLKYLLGAFDYVRRDGYDVRLIVAGPQNPDPDSARYMAERGLGEGVVFVGAPTFEDLPSYHHSADIFVSPALGRESFGMVIAEAMAAGKPCIVSDIAGHRSVIGSPDNAVLTKPGDEMSLKNAIKFLIDNPAERERLGKAGQEKAKEYDWPIVADQVYDYYEKVLEKTAKK